MVRSRTRLFVPPCAGFMLQCTAQAAATRSLLRRFRFRTAEECGTRENACWRVTNCMWLRSQGRDSELFLAHDLLLAGASRGTRCHDGRFFAEHDRDSDPVPLRGSSRNRS